MINKLIGTFDRKLHLPNRLAHAHKGRTHTSVHGSLSRPAGGDTHGSKTRIAMLFYLTQLATTAVAFTPGSKPAPKSTRAATNTIVSSNICGYEFPALPTLARAPGRPIWFEVEAQPANPDLSCYETGEGWLCAYDTDIKLEIDAEDSY